MPRSGAGYFSNMIRDMYYHNDNDMAPDARPGEWSQQPNWVIVSREPLLFLANFEDIYQIVTIRNPIDNIASIVHRTSYGFGTKTIAGRPDIIEENLNKIKNNKEGWLKESIYQNSMMWDGYAKNSMRNINKLIPFTFEQTIYEMPTVLKNIHAIASPEDNARFRTQEEIDKFIKSRQGALSSDVNETSGASNIYPTEKPDSYYEVLEAVNAYPRINELLDTYEECLNIYKNIQANFPYKFSN